MILGDGIKRKIFLIPAVTVFIVSCTPAKVTEDNIQATAATLDYGDFKSSTLAVKAWEASASKNYPELFAYTRKCVDLYCEQGKKMNAELTYFEPSETAAEKWALNDVGTCLFIMANAYAELDMFPEAAKTYRTLADDYKYSQCWDPKGWFWRPAAGADLKADEYKYRE